MNHDLSRRQFFRAVQGAAVGAGALAPTLAFGAPQAKGGGPFAKTLIYMFLRGGIDGLNLVPPSANSRHRADYESLRPNIQVPTSGDNPVLPISGTWGFHPAASELRDIYSDDRKLAIIHGTGLPRNEITRSHFDAMEMMELGTPGVLSTATGWLARHLQSSPGVTGQEIIRSLSSGSNRPSSLRGDFATLTVSDVDSYHPRDHWSLRDAYLQGMDRLYRGNGPLELAGATAMDTVRIVQDLDLDTSLPGGVSYPNNSAGRNLENIGRMIDADLGLRAATIDVGGWDTHNGQGDFGGGSFFGQVEDISEAIGAFWRHMKARGKENEIALVIHSDFGRRARQNGQSGSGTDHGSGNVMFVLGGLVEGGTYGRFRGLSNDTLYEGQDVAPMVDFRQVLGTVVRDLMGNPFTNGVFPGFGTFESLEFAESNFDPEVMFANGFESGA
ncbi:MAG: DUF1501 domain-containing protein [Pseudomonadota bacterium]